MSHSIKYLLFIRIRQTLSGSRVATENSNAVDSWGWACGACEVVLVLDDSQHIRPLDAVDMSDTKQELPALAYEVAP